MVRTNIRIFLWILLSLATCAFGGSTDGVGQEGVLKGVDKLGAETEQSGLAIGAAALVSSKSELRQLQPAVEQSSVPPPRLRRRFIDDQDDYALDDDEDEDDEGPDFWDVVVWFGSQLGRALKLLLVALGKLAYTIYVGIAYGWHEAEHGTAKPTLNI